MEKEKNKEAEIEKKDSQNRCLAIFRTVCMAISCVMLAVTAVFTVKSAGYIKTILANTQNRPAQTQALQIYKETTAENRDILLFTESETEKETTEAAQNGKTDYVINKNSRKIHLANCSFAEKMKAENRQEARLSPEELEEYFGNGYSPCSSCLGGEK